MSADTMYAKKRAAERKPWKSGFCGLRMAKESHAKCKGGYDRQIEPVGWVPCACDCHKTPRPEELLPAGVEPEGVQAPPVEVLEPVVLADLDEETYHGDPVPERLGRSLSHSGAKVLLTKTPAHFAYDREHGRPPKRDFDFGHAAHRMVLGKGLEIVEVKADSWRTNAAKEADAAARAEGKTPLLTKDLRKVEAMAKVLEEHPNAGPLFKGAGLVETSLFWQDGATGVFRRCRLDFARLDGPGKPLIVDYKSTADASPGAFAKSAANFGYFMQDPWYCDGVLAHGLADPLDLGFAFVAQEKDPPYAVAVYFLSHDDWTRGTHANRKALEIYAECQSSGEWPAYAADPVELHLPSYFTRRLDEENAA